MSVVADQEYLEGMDDEFVEPKPVAGSLEERVAERRRVLESKTTELFDVPGFEGVFQVELRIVGAKRQHAMYQSHERVHDEYQQSLRTAADLVLAATVDFHEVKGEDLRKTEGVTWKKLACAFDKALDEATLKGRVALIRLLGEEGAITLAGEYKQWLRQRGQKVERELEADF